MIISFTGTQKGLSSGQRRLLAFHLLDFKCSELVHGDCIGADAEANEIALDCGVKQFTICPSSFAYKRAFCFFVNNRVRKTEHEPFVWHPIEVNDKLVWVRWYPTKPPLERNKDIVNLGTQLIACPNTHEMKMRSGTWTTIRYGWRVRKGSKTLIIPPIVD